MKIEDTYIDIVTDFKTRFDTSNYELDRPLPSGKNGKVIGLMKEKYIEARNIMYLLRKLTRLH